MSETNDDPSSTSLLSFGFTGFVLGSIAFTLASLLVFVGPFAPQQELGVSIGELSATVGKSALREFFGFEQPAPTARVWDVDRVLKLLATLGAVGAIMLGVFGAFKREHRLMSVWAVGLGSAAIVIQFLAWVVLVIAAVMIVMAVLSFWEGLF